MCLVGTTRETSPELNMQWKNNNWTTADSSLTIYAALTDITRISGAAQIASYASDKSDGQEEHRATKLTSQPNTKSKK